MNQIGLMEMLINENEKWFENITRLSVSIQLFVD